MQFRVHRPGLLLILLLIVAGMVTAAVLVAGGDGEGTAQPVGAPVPPKPTPAPVSEDEQKAVLEILRKEGLVENVTSRQDWTTSDFHRWPLPSKPNTIGFNVNLPEAEKSSGPWIQVRCQGTRQTYGYRDFGNIWKLYAAIDPTDKSIVEFVVEGPWPDEEETFGKLIAEPEDTGGEHKLYELESGKPLFEGTLGEAPRSCPSGFEDD